MNNKHAQIKRRDHQKLSGNVVHVEEGLVDLEAQQLKKEQHQVNLRSIRFGYTL